MRIVTIILFFCVLAATGLGQDQANRKPRTTIRATVVAGNVSNRFQFCYHVCGLSLIVKLEKPSTYEYALVSVTFMDDPHLEERGRHWKLIEESKKWKFKVFADEPPRRELKQFAQTYDIEAGKDTTQTVQMQAWYLLKGSEDVKLPFGQTIPSYLVDVGEFKSFK